MAELAPIEAALAALLDGVEPLAGETVPLAQAAGRVLAGPVWARQDVPAFDNSAMDGYALRIADADRPLPMSQRIAAGQPAEPLAPGSCARIFTGGQVPEGADCVVMQERVEVTEAGIRFPDDLTTGDNIRRRGRDVTAGSELLPAGLRLEAAALGHLAGQGIVEVEVRRRPRVALINTGDEVVEPGTPLAPGQLYNSNRPMLARLIEGFGGQLVCLAKAPDDLEATRQLLADAAEQADLVITTGGVSVGEEDHVKPAVESLGRLDLWRLALRPGKPLALGRLPRPDGGEVRFVGLPGNPVSSYVGAWLFLRPLLGALLDCPALARLPSVWASADFTTRTQARSHYLRVKLRFTPDGPVAEAFADQNSGVLSSCVMANALAVVPAHSEVAPGDRLECLWLGEA